MEHQSARWRAEDADDAPHQQPMAAGLRPAQRKAPTADQKKVRREMARKTAYSREDFGNTVRETFDWLQSLRAQANDDAAYSWDPEAQPKTASLTVCAACTAPSSGCCGQCGCLVARTATLIESPVANSRGQMLLNSGDAIQMPNGQVVNIKGIRRHETSGDHYYLDTDAGTTVVPYSTTFKVVPHGSNSTRMPPNPDYGRPGGNFNNQPGPVHPDEKQSNTHGNACPVCGTKGSLEQTASGYVCSRCGYKASVQGGQTFSDSTQSLDPRSFQASKTHMTAVARRAAEVLATPEGDTL